MEFKYLAGGKPVELTDVLEVREWRQDYQERLKKQYPKNTVVSVKLNIIGSIKNSPCLKEIFIDGWTELKTILEKQEQLLFFRLFLDKITGPEILLVSTGDLGEIKKLAIKFEKSFYLGRLFDVDVMAENDDNYQLSRTDLGFLPRKCLVCGKNAKYCIKEQRHTTDEVSAKIEEYIAKYKNDIQKIKEIDLAKLAVESLIYEVVTTPKPGLVDPVSNGAHQDMNVFTFIDSAQSLVTYFNEAQEIGFKFYGSDLKQMFIELRQVGIVAENTMYNATKGVNTHKGAIFSLGIFVCATAFLCKQNKYSRDNLANIIKKMTQDVLEEDFRKIKVNTSGKLSAGEKQYLRYGKKGIRGQAMAGYPTVLKLAVPFLEKTQGTTNERLLDTLMYIAGNVDDSNLIKRAGTPAIIDEIKKISVDFLDKGGSKSDEGMECLKEWDKIFIERNLSLGGSADLLILTIFIGKLEGIL